MSMSAFFPSSKELTVGRYQTAFRFVLIIMYLVLFEPAIRKSNLADTVPLTHDYRHFKKRKDQIKYGGIYSTFIISASLALALAS
jgi:hypothetical protein